MTEKEIKQDNIYIYENLTNKQKIIHGRTHKNTHIHIHTPSIADSMGMCGRALVEKWGRVGERGLRFSQKISRYWNTLRKNYERAMVLKTWTVLSNQIMTAPPQPSSGGGGGRK